MHSLRQKRLFARQEFGLTAHGLRVNTSTWKNGHEYVLPYEELGAKREYRLRRTNWLVLMTFLAVFALEFGLFVSEWTSGGGRVAPLLWLGAALFCGVCALITALQSRRQSLVFTGGSHSLELRIDHPSRQQVEAFADALQERIRQRHVHNFLAEEAYYTADYRLNRLRWLRQIGALSDSQFRHLLHRAEQLGASKKRLKSAAEGFAFSIN